MQLIKILRKIEYLDYLIRRKATGKPCSPAVRLHLSERQVYRLIEELKILVLIKKV